MKKPRQLELLPKRDRKRDALFCRSDSRYWQARFFVDGQWHRRSTAAVSRDAARVMLRCWKQQIERRGKPRREECFADKP